MAGVQGELKLEMDETHDAAGELPPGWAWATLGHILPLHYGKALPARERDDAGAFGVFGSSGLVGKHSAALSPANTILVGRKGSAGAVHFSAQPCWPIDTVYFTKPHSELEPRYWYFCLSSLQLGRLDQSTAIPSLSRDNYSPIKVMVPPLAEQRRIVDRIDELFSRIEAGERAVEAARAGLKRYRKAVLKAAVTGALTEDWREAHPAQETAEALLTRILKERRAAWEAAEIAKHKAKGKPLTDKQKQTLAARYKPPAEPDPDGLPDLPQGWVWATLAQLTDLKGGVTVDRKKVPKDPVTLPYLRVANVQNGYIDLSEVKEITVDRTKAEATLLQPGDILLNEGGDLDKLGRGWVWRGQIDPCIHQNHVFRARPVVDGLSPVFISHYANAMGQDFFMSSGKQTTNLASISLTAISKLPIPLPPAAEQAEIVSRVEEALSRADAAEATLDAQTRAARALKQSILKAAFTGHLVPQNSTDEPTSELLKRVKEESH